MFTSSTGITSSKAKVMLISDDPETARVWAYCVKLAGADVVLSEFNEKALSKWSDEIPDLIIVESIYQKKDDLELCRRLREETPVPILLLPSGDDEIQLYEAYRAGVDECITPPVSPRLFISKVKSWLRRTQVVPSAALDDVNAGIFRLDTNHRILYSSENVKIRLTNLESRLLYLLMTHPCRTLETDYLVEGVWGHYGNGDSVLLKNLVYRLRRKIEPDPGNPRYLLTEANGGYRLMTS